MSHNAVWLRFDILNNTRRAQVRHFMVDVPWLDYIDAYLIDNT